MVYNCRQTRGRYARSRRSRPSNSGGVVNLLAKWGETSVADGLQVSNSDLHPTDAGHEDIKDMVMAALA